MDRAALLSQVSAGLAGRQLVYFGTRGDDIESLAELPELASAFSIINKYDRRNVINALAMEDLSGRRVDLDVYDIDDEPDREAFAAFRLEALNVLSTPSVVFTYRPSALVSSLCFARDDRCQYLGMFRDHQVAFEHKPWVESSIRALGIPAIEWRYVADEEQLETLRFLDHGPAVLRRSRTTGGTGVVRIDDPSHLRELWPQERDAYVSVAPFIDDALPVNVGAVVWSDGITVHPASVQLIGIPSCTQRPFGFCGNDFGAMRTLDAGLLKDIESHVREIGDWLRQHGYIGAFGVDFLVSEGVPLFTEINPRFQGSTHLSAQISVERGESCILLDHLAALLRLPCPPSVSLGEYADGVDLAHVVVHWKGNDPRPIDGPVLERALAGELPVVRSDVATHPGLMTNPGATMLRMTTRERLTTSGFELRPDWGDAIDRHLERLTENAGPRDRIPALTTAPVRPITHAGPEATP